MGQSNFLQTKFKLFIDFQSADSIKRFFSSYQGDASFVHILDQPGIASFAKAISNIHYCYKAVYCNIDKVLPTNCDVQSLAVMADDEHPLVHALTFQPFSLKIYTCHHDIRDAYLRHKASPCIYHPCIDAPFDMFSVDVFSLLKTLEHHDSVHSALISLPSFLTFHVSPKSKKEEWFIPNMDSPPPAEIVFENEARICALEETVKAQKRLLSEKAGYL